MSKWDEPAITINGHILTVGQAMTVRVGIENFASTIHDLLRETKDDQTLMAYLDRIMEIRTFMQVLTSRDSGVDNGN